MRPTRTEHAGALSLIVAGAGLGPAGLAILTPAVLGAIDPVIPVALAALGVLAWFDASAATTGGAATSAIRTAIIGGTVAAGLVLLAPGLNVSSAPAGVLAIVAGVCAAVAGPSTAALPLIVGALALGWIKGGAASGIWLTAHVVAVAAALALAGWLLLRKPQSGTQGRVFTVAMLLLIGGTADSLSMSALLGGLVAGACWQRIGGAMPATLWQDVAALRHPLFGLLLLVAGGLTTFSPEVLALAIGYALLRVGGGALATLVAAPEPGGSSEGRLLATVIAVAFALNALRTVGPDTAPVLAVVVIGTLVSRLLETAWQPGRAAA